ncbi:hypothetical protein [Xanthomarina sp. GH4-25]
MSTLIAAIKGFIDKKLLMKQYIKRTIKKSPNVWRINPVFK